MNPTFFSKYTGQFSERLCEVTTKDARVVVDHDATLAASIPLHFTAEQAKALGRALIKAGKFVEREGAK